MRIKFWGAARTVTGSMHLLLLKDGRKILLECGIYQGSEGFKQSYNREFPCPPSEIDLLILSHAHIDHCGNIPQLVKEGFRGEIVCTHATYDLASILLADSAKIQESDAEYENRGRRRRGEPEIEALYTTKDVAPALSHFITYPYDRWVTVMPGVKLMFRDAGHMLGSASVNLRIDEDGKEIKLGFTGDVGRRDREILRDPQPMEPADFVISESTYGGREHESLPETEEMLLKLIHETCVERKGKLLIPAFSVGRTQDIIHILDRLQNQGRMPKIPVYVDSPLAINATRIFEVHPECFNEELIDYMHRDPDPFGYPGLHYTRDVASSKRLNVMQGPAVIISASGMITAGRILHHLRHNVENPNCTVLIVGYCAQGTLGERLINGAKEIRIFGDEYRVKARIERLNGLSAHADQSEMFDFIEQSHPAGRLKHLFLVHGEGDRSQMLKDYFLERGYSNISIPERGTEFEI